MIFDSFENIDLYRNISDNIYTALKYAKNFDPAQPDGTYEINGKDVYAIAQSYTTAPAEQKQFEGHKKYIDIQLMLSGVERLDTSPVNTESPTTPYDPEKDALFQKEIENFSSLVLIPGLFTILYPNDLHRPGIQNPAPQPIRKLVIKVKI